MLINKIDHFFSFVDKRTFEFVLFHLSQSKLFEKLIYHQEFGQMLLLVKHALDTLYSIKLAEERS